MSDGSSQRLRVAHITQGLDVGGQEKLLVEFARHADADRFELHVVSLGGRGKLAETLEGLGCRIHTLGTPDGLRPGLVWRLFRLFRRERFAVVHTHDDRPLLYAGLAAWLARVPRRVHTHHHGFVPQISERQGRLVRWAARTVHHFICVSHDSQRHLIAQGLPEGRVLALHNGIDLDRFPYHGPQPGGAVVTVARLSPEKDIATLLRAARLVADACPDFRLEIAGAGPCDAELRRLADELRLQGHVQFLGEVGDVPALLARARLFVLPSQAEGISLTVLEAMATGLPVVTTLVGGNPEVVLGDTTGTLVPPADPPALADAIVRLLADPERAQLMGRAARRRVEANFDVRAMVARYEALYEGRSIPDNLAGGPVHRVWAGPAG